MTDRPPIPRNVKRLVRQDARFGCCRCGLPIYEYHHIQAYADGGGHTPDNLMLLCPNDHTLATQGGLTRDEQCSLKANPYNVRQGYAAGSLAITQRTCVVDVGGGVMLAGEGAWIVIDHEPLLSLQLSDDGQLLLSVTLYAKDGELLAEIVDNEWIAGDPLPWDIESAHRRLKLSLASRAVVLKVDATGEPIRMTGKLWHHGAPVGMSVSRFSVASASWVDHGLANFELHVDTETLELRQQPRGSKPGTMVVEPDRLRRYARCVEAWRNLSD